MNEEHYPQHIHVSGWVYHRSQCESWKSARHDITTGNADAAILDEVYATAGAIVMGGHMFDVGLEP